MWADERYMREALAEARAAYQMGEIPIGAVLVAPNGDILSRAHNLRETAKDATAHAEILAIRKASEALGRWRLFDATLYVTIEPCPMCAGALVMSRVRRLVYGAADIRAGAVESLFNIVDCPQLNHRLQVTAGVLEDECRAIMRQFFQARRKKRVEER